MTKEELDEEAEEYAEINKPFLNRYDCVCVFKDGAEFGYNKANEWHKVADGDLPQKDKTCLVIFHNKYSDELVTDISRYSIYLKKWWFIHDLQDMEEDVIAWCEIPTFKE